MKKEKFKFNNNYLFQDMDSEMIIYSNDQSELITLNETATLIFKELKKYKTIEEIAKILSKTYSIPQKTALDDIQELIKKLRKNNIILD